MYNNLFVFLEPVDEPRPTYDCGQLMQSSSTASLHKLAAGRKLATTHLNVSNRQMCGCTGFKSGSYNKSFYNRPFKNDTGFRFIEISKYDDGGQLTTRGQLMQGSSKFTSPVSIQ